MLDTQHETSVIFQMSDKSKAENNSIEVEFPDWKVYLNTTECKPVLPIVSITHFLSTLSNAPCIYMYMYITMARVSYFVVFTWCVSSKTAPVAQYAFLSNFFSSQMSLVKWTSLFCTIFPITFPGMFSNSIGLWAFGIEQVFFPGFLINNYSACLHILWWVTNSTHAWRNLKKLALEYLLLHVCIDIFRVTWDSYGAFVRFGLSQRLRTNQVLA